MTQCWLVLCGTRHLGPSPVFCTSAPLVISVLSPSVSQALIRVSKKKKRCTCGESCVRRDRGLWLACPRTLMSILALVQGRSAEQEKPARAPARADKPARKRHTNNTKLITGLSVTSALHLSSDPPSPRDEFETKTNVACLPQANHRRFPPLTLR